MTTNIFSSIIVSLALLPSAYLQVLLNNTGSCSTATFAAKTVFDFWHESVRGCDGYGVQNLLETHKRISLNTAKRDGDQISSLIDGHIRSALMQYLFGQLMAFVTTKSLTVKPDVEKVLDDLYCGHDKLFLLEIWQKVLDESLLFVSIEDILQQLLLLTNGDLKLHLLDYLFKRYENQGRESYRFLPLLTYAVTSVIKQREEQRAPVTDPILGRLVGRLPEQLLIIFQSLNYNVSVLNVHSNEYIFAERNNAATPNKRYLFSFMPAKNKFRVKGKFKVQISSSGLLTLGVHFNHSYGYLTAEGGSAFICLHCAVTTAQWWQVLWPDSGSKSIDQQFVLFQNAATQDLLCSTSISHNDLLLISTADLEQHRNDSQCHWQVVKRIK